MILIGRYNTVYLKITYRTEPMELAASEDQSVQQEMLSFSGYM